MYTYVCILQKYMLFCQDENKKKYCFLRDLPNSPNFGLVWVLD